MDVWIIPIDFLGSADLVRGNFIPEAWGRSFVITQGDKDEGFTGPKKHLPR